jgi:hypothetical protein
MARRQATSSKKTGQRTLAPTRPRWRGVSGHPASLSLAGSISSRSVTAASALCALCSHLNWAHDPPPRLRLVAVPDLPRRREGGQDPGPDGVGQHPEQAREPAGLFDRQHGGARGGDPLPVYRVIVSTRRHWSTHVIRMGARIYGRA